jgi:adenylate cyclase class 2
MYEVELKLRADHEAVRRRLMELGVSRTGTVSQVDVYYDAPHRDFASTDEALRVREERTVHEPTDVVRRMEWDESPEEVRTRLTYKGPLVDDTSKTRQEFETGVTDGTALSKLLDGLGFEPAARVRKEREQFEFDGYAVTLDRVEDVGEFVEVEREVPESDVEAARERAFEVVAELGLDPEAGIRTSYLEMVLEGRRDDARGDADNSE